MKELHTMIVWSKASEIKPDVEEALRANFKLISMVEIYWEKQLFFDNLKVFYSHSQKHRTTIEYDSILKNKINHCGDRPFTLYVYEDKHPRYDYRITSSGNRRVNINVFDLKASLRKSIGGGHKIHASDTTFESNKDLTLLLGLNLEDYIEQLPKASENTAVYKRNCVGVNGYKTIETLFYVLNNTIDYCVIRNFECLPKSYTIEGHGDIDLLVADFNYIKYLTLAKSYYPNLDYRVHYGIKISDELIPFDFRYVGDGYYDINWQTDILKSSTYFNSIIRVPNTRHYFYTLLYHAYIQKSSIKDDYYERLLSMSKALNIAYQASFSVGKVKDLLDTFIHQHHYSYTIPSDKTVYFNQLFLNFDHSRVEKFGELISTQQARLGNDILFTEVYDNDKEITKFGSELIIKNEIEYLTALQDSNIVPKLYNYTLKPNNYFVVIEKLKGVQLNEAIENPKFWNKKNIEAFIFQCIQFNTILIKNNILHRDIRPENIMVTFDEGKNIDVKLIDFGWATQLSEMKHTLNPLGLGSGYKYSEGQYSDLYSTGKFINEIFKGFRFKTLLVSSFDVRPNDYSDLESVTVRIKKLKAMLNLEQDFTFRDNLLLVVLRHRKVFKMLLILKRALKIKMKR